MKSGALYWGLPFLFILMSCSLTENNETISERPDNYHFKQVVLDDVESIRDDYYAQGMPWVKSTGPYGTLDTNGIPIVNYSFGDYRNPVTTCGNAMGFHQRYLREYEESDLTYFLNNADWLLETMDENGYLHYEFEYTHGGQIMDLGWTSGMAQGEALSVLSVAYNLTSDDKYLTGAELVFSTFSDSTSEYRFVVIEDDYLYLEEYPSPDSCHVLNGFIFGMWGLWDFYTITESEESLRLFKGSLKTILDNYYDWYLSENKTVSCLHGGYYENYHNLHLILMQSLFNLTKMTDFLTIRLIYSH